MNVESLTALGEKRTENARIWERFEEFAGSCEAYQPARQAEGG